MLILVIFYSINLGLHTCSKYRSASKWMQPTVTGLKFGSKSVCLQSLRIKRLNFKIFTGHMQSDVVCNKCGNVSRTIDPLRDISLDIPNDHQRSHHSQPKRQKTESKKTNLMDCLRKFTRKEQLGNHSKINCL